MEELRTPQAADAALQEERALLYKHSDRCPLSALAYAEVRRFREAHSELPVYLVDVNAHRDVSRHVAERTGVVHHSPQAILLHHGRPGWHASHLQVTAEALERQLGLLEE